MRCSHQDDEGVKFLLEHGADPNAKNQYGDTAIFAAVQGANVTILLALLERGEDTNAINMQGDRPIHIAVMIGNRGIHNENNISLETHRRILDLLVEFGANVDVPSSYGDLPLVTLARYGRGELLKRNEAYSDVNKTLDIILATFEGDMRRSGTLPIYSLHVANASEQREIVWTIRKVWSNFDGDKAKNLLNLRLKPLGLTLSSGSWSGDSEFITKSWFLHQI